MTEITAEYIRTQKRFRGIENEAPISFTGEAAVEEEILRWLLSKKPEEGQTEALAKELAAYTGVRKAVPVSSGQAALHLAVKLAAEKLYGSAGGIAGPEGIGKGGVLRGKRVFCSDLTEITMITPVVTEGGEPVFIDASETDWSMDPEVLKSAFERYPEVRLVIMNQTYGYPGQTRQVREICEKYGALLIEYAADAMGAEPIGRCGDYTVLDFGKDRILTAGTGGALLTNEAYAAEKAGYWSRGAKAKVPWNQHEELGYQYEMSEWTAAILREKLTGLAEIIEKKKNIYDRYKERLERLGIAMIPATEETKPNYWKTAISIEGTIQFREARTEREYLYRELPGTAAPMEIYDVLAAYRIESRPVQKPMSRQPIFRNNEHFTLDGSWRSYEHVADDVYWQRTDMAGQYYETGLLLPSPPTMTEEQQDMVMALVERSFEGI